MNHEIRWNQEFYIITIQICIKLWMEFTIRISVDFYIHNHSVNYVVDVVRHLCFTSMVRHGTNSRSKLRTVS
jgi:hypothetical protein